MDGWNPLPLVEHLAPAELDFLFNASPGELIYELERVVRHLAGTNQTLTDTAPETEPIRQYGMCLLTLLNDQEHAGAMRASLHRRGSAIDWTQPFPPPLLPSALPATT
jgi:hypothetical protein